jgi:D-alanyl-D-alanine carboxypeptidase (penicillin-binding protein 5/6)
VIPFSFLRVLLAPVLALWGLLAAAQVPQPPEVAARSFLVMDLSAQQTLAAKDIDVPVEPGALAQLMTQYLVLDALRAARISLQQRLPVSERAWKTGGSRMFIDPKMSVPVLELLKGSIVLSGNDAAVALAEGVGGSVEHFVELMNQQAQALGLKSTAYKNPAGLAAPGQTTTARDLAVLASRIVQDFPEYLHLYALKKYRYEGTPTANDANRNLLLVRDPSVDGLGTGQGAAGYGIAATARRDFPNLQGRRMLAVVLGAPSELARGNEAQKLLNWGFTAYEDIKLFEGNQVVTQPPVWKGAQKSVKLGQTVPIVVAVPAGAATKIRTQVARADPLIAPFQKGQALATLKISSGEQLLREAPLVALEPVEQAGVLSRAWDALRLWIK